METLIDSFVPPGLHLFMWVDVSLHLLTLSAIAGSGPATESQEVLPK
ncbi:MAG TPA: hypothetical protein VIQ23_08770 [Hanamia sp.]